jgi:hypothetical protein
MSIGFVQVKKIEYFISKNQVKNQEWLWGFLSKNRNNLKNSIGYWAGFLVKTRDCIPTFKCIEPPNPPHTCWSLTFKKPRLNLLLEISNFHRPRPVVDFLKKKSETQTRLLSKKLHTHPTLIRTQLTTLELAMGQ